MGIEIEQKYRLPDPAGLRRRLVELKARRADYELEINHIFDTPDGRLRTTGCGLRLRERRNIEEPGLTPVIELTFKGPPAQGRPKVRTEHEALVSEADAMFAILAGLGYHEAVCFEKRRETWAMDGVRVQIDELPQLGFFVEVEGPSVAAVNALAERLGMTPDLVVRETYVELAARQCDSADGKLITLQF